MDVTKKEPMNMLFLQYQGKFHIIEVVISTLKSHCYRDIDLIPSSKVVHIIIF